jgi:hypothetical protein
MGQFLAAARREGKPLWRTFWMGGTLASYSGTTTLQEGSSRSTTSRIITALDLNNVPWNMALSAALGIWLMAAPSALGITGRAADSDHVTGALIVTFSVIAFGEIVRPARFVNILLGIWLIGAPWLLDGDTGVSRWNAVLAGIMLIPLALRRGRIEEQFAGWNRYLI